MADECRVVVLPDNGRRVTVVLRPVGSVVSVFARGVGQAQRYLSLSVSEQWRLDARHQLVAVGTAERQHVHRLSAGAEVRLHLCVPQVQLLSDVRQLADRNGLSEAVR